MAYADFDSLDFISFQADASRSKDPFVVSEIEGSPCLDCKDKCRGLSVHPWRKYCIFCKCAVEFHDIPQNSSYQNLPEDRMCVEEKPPRSSLTKVKEAHTEGYEWIPAGITSVQIKDFMSRLPGDKVPRLDSEGARYRHKQLVYQMPLQDFSSKHCRKLALEQKMVMDNICAMRIDKALGVGAVRPGLTCTMPSSCVKCSIPISTGDMAVFAFRAGPELCWHVECFVCSQDGVLLVDYVYCWDAEKKKLYCPRHWSESLKPRCAGCEELIYVGEYSLAMDEHWHPGHLCCFYCDESLSQQKFVTVDGKPSCIKCYDKNFANNCENCAKTIGPGTKDVDVRGKHWHEECFTCSQCKRALLNQGFTFKDDKLVCHPCRGITPSKVCEACGGDFSPGEKKVGYQSQTYHEKCFTCDDCKQPIGTQQFVRRDDKRLCGNCFDSSYAKICAKCNNPIKSALVKHDGSSYHSECFSCSICSQPLAGKPFTKQEGNNVCQNCYRKNFAKRCAACDQLIEGSVKFVAYDEKFFHRDCFTCTKCGKALAGEKFRIVGSDKVCINCSS